MRSSGVASACAVVFAVGGLACGRSHLGDFADTRSNPGSSAPYDGGPSNITTGSAPPAPRPTAPPEPAPFERLVLLEEECRATAVSADGATAGGYCVPGELDGPLVPVLWQLGGTPTLTELPLPPASISALSADGSVVLGNFDTEVFRWSEQGTQILAEQGKAYDLNAVGTASVGVWSGTGAGDGAYLWTETDGTVALPLPAGTDRCEARALSDDGTFIVGQCRRASETEAGERRWDAVRWGPKRDPEWLPVPDDATGSSAAAISADGTTIVGNIWSGEYRVTRWTENGFELLSEPGLTVKGVSHDGRRVLLEGRSLGPHVWEADGKVSRVLEELSDTLSLEAWEFLSLAGASGDLRVIVGNLQHAADDTRRRRGAYLIRLP